MPKTSQTLAKSGHTFEWKNVFDDSSCYLFYGESAGQISASWFEQISDTF